MTPPPKLRIPSAHKPTVVALASLAEQDWSILEGIVANATSLRYRDLVEAINGRIKGWGTEQSQELVETLTSMSFSVARHAARAAYLAAGVASSPDLDISDEDRKLLEARLEALLTSNGIGLITKAATVVAAHERILTGSLILTDIRPLFSEDRDLPPLAAHIAHTLLLEYIKDDEEKKIFLALSAEQLSDLAMEVKKAQQKQKSLNSFLADAGLPLHEETA